MHSLYVKNFCDWWILCYFLRIAAVKTWSSIQSRNCFFYFSNNTFKTCWDELKTSRNINIKYIFHFEAYFHELDTFQTSCLNAFKPKLLKILHTNQFQASWSSDFLFRGLSIENQNLKNGRILVIMGEIWSFENIFGFYNFRTLDTIRFVALFKS